MAFFRAYAFQETPDSLFSEAENRYKNGDYKLSLKLYNELLSDYPMSMYVPDAGYRIAVIKVRTGDLHGAEKSFEKIENRYAFGTFAPYIPFWKGVISYKKKDYSAAVSFLTEFITSGAKNFRMEGIVYKARSEYELSDIDKAVKTLELLDNEGFDFKNDPAVFSFYIFILEQSGNYGKVFSLMKEVSIESWDTVFRERIILSLAEAYYKTGQNKQAEKYYLDVLTSSPDIASVGFIRLFTLYKNNVDMQKDILAKAQLVLSGYPGLINNFYIHIGIESFKRKEYDIAFSYLNRVWQSSKSSEISYLVPLYLAFIHAENKKYNEAENVLLEYLQVKGQRDEMILYTLGDFFIKDGKWQNAQGILSEFLNYFPQSSLTGKVSWMYAYALYKQEKYQSSLTVIDTALKDGRTGNLTDSFLRLKSKLYISTGKTEQAATLLKEYIPLHPDNVNAKLDFIILSFQQRDYLSVFKMYTSLKKSIDGTEKGDSGVLLLSSYIAGVAMIGEGKTDEGIDLLKTIDRKYLLENNLESIYPYVAYYIGWAYYTKAAYNEAVRWFSVISEKYKESAIYLNSLYLAGWSSYLSGNFNTAADTFALYSKTSGSDGSGKGAFYYGKSMLAGGDAAKAELIFQNIYTSMPDDPFADDALFNHAHILEQMGKDDEAIALYRELSKKYKRSLLTEEGLYKIGELYFKNREYDNARRAFYTYRSRYPSGKLTDASLYWGGLAALKMGEKYGALLVWEKLVNTYKDSTFRSEVLRKIATIYSEEGEYKKALEYYSEFILSYPGDSAVKGINLEIKKLKLLKSGLGEREASLLVSIESHGISNAEGREASIELASLYLYNYEEKWTNAYDLLKKVVSYKDKDRAAAARAQYYIGEYFSKKYQWTEAVQAFVKAASMNPKDKDLAAISIYKAAENALRAGDRITAEKMVNLLELNFPSSQWLIEGRKLLEGRN